MSAYTLKDALRDVPHVKKRMVNNHIGNIEISSAPIGTEYWVYPVAQRGKIGNQEIGEVHDVMLVFVTRVDDPEDLGGWMPACIFEENSDG